MKLSEIFFFLASALVAVSASVIQLNDENFKDVVLSSGKYTLVKFYADWCRHCKNMAPAYEEVGDIFEQEPQVQVARINGDKEGRKMSKKYNIEGFPTLFLFHGDDEPVEYQGNRDAESISNFVQQVSKIRLSQPKVIDTFQDFSKVVDLDERNFQKEVLSNRKGSSLVAFTASWCPHCERLKPVWEKLANVIFDRDEQIKIAQVVTDLVPSEKIKEQFEIDSFPTILYFDPNKVHEDGLRRPEPYFGDRSLQDLVNFVNEKADLYRDTNGELLETAGRIHHLDKLISERLGTTPSSEAGIKLLKELDKLMILRTSSIVDKQKIISPTDDFSAEPYYRKLLNKIISGDADFIEREYKRLNRLLKEENENLTRSAIDSFKKRINTLKAFLKQ
ncbi:Piso0_005426 [Millerozyma farinosa CBS 7064]|uniref:protein disulfide-isomerase n=1 Tax=Pichia sorbitophila (strain ATCC MYA-4447 / BCRC 22081 / CBS 7064 / NBRC 10061 / NRRL Y-12695) TaxID=559304 RepID=G8Y527_PICSO|nr:Piso0_005426 [Millerozyma farinosa CBS 7064]